MSGIWKSIWFKIRLRQQDFNKTTFRKGDSFSARILNINKESGELSFYKTFRWKTISCQNRWFHR